MVELLLLLAQVGGPAWIPARPDHAWSFPRDHMSHPGTRTEWWYFTGQLERADDPAARFGYQFTFFRVGLLPGDPGLDSAWSTADLIMGHAALTDLGAGVHRFSELLYRPNGFLGGFGGPADHRIAWSRAPAGTEGLWTLDREGEGFAFAMQDDRQGFAFELATTPLQPRVLQGPGGYSRKGAGPTSASLYYSYPRLATTGTLRVAGRTYRVTGQSWMDQEFGSHQLEPQQVGWDWFSLQLDDQRALMLYLLRDAGGGVDHARGTLVEADGRVRYLEAGDFRVRATATWTSPESGARYPARWILEIPDAGIFYEVIPRLAAQENRSQILPGLHYYEGSVEVRGADQVPCGTGYVELTGHGTSLHPGI